MPSFFGKKTKLSSVFICWACLKCRGSRLVFVKKNKECCSTEVWDTFWQHGCGSSWTETHRWSTLDIVLWQGCDYGSQNQCCFLSNNSTVWENQCLFPMQVFKLFDNFHFLKAIVWDIGCSFWSSTFAVKISWTSTKFFCSHCRFIRPMEESNLKPNCSKSTSKERTMAWHLDRKIQPQL